MGEVYRAADPRLEREVALKVLPHELASDAEQLERFRREALTLASLNHPNIATIHGFEDRGDGSRVLVLELVEGESLEQRLERGALPVVESLHVCAQVAEALEMAHERGVVHRDLKPGNVMLGPRGLVKVLDFGLAKRGGGLVALSLKVRPAPGPSGAPAALAGNGPAAGAGERVTRHGTVIGTPGYMSPEQVLAGAQDERTDVFAFGCVLYECLSGRRAFDGRDEFEIMAAVLSEPVDLNRLPLATPARIRQMLEGCLAKEAAHRIDAMQAVRFEIEEALGVRRAAAERAGQAAAIPHNLPQALSSFVGRARELEAGAALLGQARLLTLTGAGGSGKTRLAYRLAEGMLEAHPDGVWVVELAALAEPERVAHATVGALGLRIEPGRAPVETLVEHLAPRRSLIVLDNCEHVLDAAAELAQRLLAECPACRLLATSREGLGVPGEHVQPVPPLELPPRGQVADPEALGRVESVRLFVERARQVQPGFAPRGAALTAVADVCRRLDGLPLAIELAAARVRVLDIEQIRSRLDDRFRLLTGGSRGALPRHQTLRAAIQWSVDQLAESERRLLRALSVFVGGWTLDAAARVCADLGDEFETIDLLTRLVEKSLVVVERSATLPPRYRFLESVRQFALELMVESGEQAGRRDRHLALFFGLAEEAESRLTGPDQGEWFARLEVEHENLLAALDWCQHRDEDTPLRGLRMTVALYRFWSARGHYDLGRRELEQAIQHDARRAPTPERANALVRVGGMALYLGDPAAARPLIEESLAISRALGDARGVARTLSGLGTVAMYQGDLDAARAFHEESLAGYRALGARRGEAVAMHNLGHVASSSRDLPAARDWLVRALAIMREVGDREYVALGLADLASLCLELDGPEAAKAPLTEAVRIARELRTQREDTEALSGAAEYAAAVGDSLRAARWAGAADAVRRSVGLPADPQKTRRRVELDAMLARALGSERHAAASAQGQALPSEEALNEALVWLEGGASEPG